jgi:hypothetical protein
MLKLLDSVVTTPGSIACCNRIEEEPIQVQYAEIRFGIKCRKMASDANFADLSAA